MISLISQVKQLCDGHINHSISVIGVICMISDFDLI
jgi:hypothetical protein